MVDDFKYCRSRSIVRAGTRVSHTFSKGLGLFEFESLPQTIVCTEWSCGATDVNAWVEAAGGFIEGALAPQVADTTKRLKQRQSGLLSEKQASVIDKANSVISTWRNHVIKTPTGDHPVSPLSEYRPISTGWSLVYPGNAFMQDIFEIIDIFEAASCSMDFVREIHPEGVYIDPGPSAAQPVPPSSGSFFGNADDTIGFKGGAITAVAIGLGGFIAWKALTS